MAVIHRDRGSRALAGITAARSAVICPGAEGLTGESSAKSKGELMKDASAESARLEPTAFGAMRRYRDASCPRLAKPLT